MVTIKYLIYMYKKRVYKAPALEDELLLRSDILDSSTLTGSLETSDLTEENMDWL